MATKSIAKRLTKVEKKVADKKLVQGKPKPPDPALEAKIEKAAVDVKRQWEEKQKQVDYWGQRCEQAEAKVERLLKVNTDLRKQIADLQAKLPQVERLTSGYLLARLEAVKRGDEPMPSLDELISALK